MNESTSEMIASENLASNKLASVEEITFSEKIHHRKVGGASHKMGGTELRGRRFYSFLVEWEESTRKEELIRKGE